MAAKAHAALTNANFPLDPEGRTMHLNIKKGDGILIVLVLGTCDSLFTNRLQFSAVAHRIVSVGAVGRAEKLAAMLDKDHPVRQHECRTFIMPSV